MCGAKQRPRRSVCGHCYPQPREAETHEGTEHPGSGQQEYAHSHTHTLLPARLRHGLHVKSHNAVFFFFFSCPVQIYSARVRCVLPNSGGSYVEGEEFMSYHRGAIEML